VSTTDAAPTAPFGERDRRREGTPGFGRAWPLVGAALVLVLVAGVAWSAATGDATPASHPRLFGGALVLEDTRQISVVDLANGQGEVQLSQVNTEVGDAKYADVQAVPVTGGTFLVNRVSGTFNFLGRDDYVVDTRGGVGLGPLTGATGAQGFGDGTDAYIVRDAPRATVSLVDPATVARAASSSTSAAEVTTLGFASLTGPVDSRPGTTAVADGDLWTLVGQGDACALVELRPAATGHGLRATTRAANLDCATTTLDSASGTPGTGTPGDGTPGAGTLGVATAGHVALYRPTGPTVTVAVGGLSGATSILPVSDLAGTLWWVAHLRTGWAVFGVAAGDVVLPPHTLRGIPAAAVLAEPAWSEGSLYTLDQASLLQPDLWVVDPSTGSVGTVAGARTYPRADRSERASFGRAEVIGVGPRVVYNNPGSLLAVVVFTDGSHAPAIVDKSEAPAVSPTGPAEIASGGGHRSPPRGKGRGTSKTPPAPARPKAAPTPAFSQQVNCRQTTEKPYQPRIGQITPSSEAALITWGYQRLDPQDCEPDTWTVHVTALGGTPQPADPTRIVNGQTQLELTGLRPTTTYEAVVTAHINTQSTASAPVSFETSQQGPDAPTSVHTTVDAAGNWVVTWTPCRTSTCYVPADDWVVTGAACGTAFVGQPPSVKVSGGRTVATVPAGSLLGNSLSFSVQGVLADGRTGNPTADHTCTQSWRPPHAGGISLAAAAVAGGQTVTATLQVSPPAGPSSAATYGSDDTVFTYGVAGRSIGPTTATSVSVPGLAPNQSYATSVRVAPAGHPGASVTVHGPQVRRDLAWPKDITATVSTQAAVGDDPDTGGATLTFHGLAPGSYAVTGTLACGSEQLGAIHGAVTTGTGDTGTVELPTFDLVDDAADCTAGTASGPLTLHDTSKPSPYGDVAQTVPGVAFSFPAPQSYQYVANYTQMCPLLAPCTDMISVHQVIQHRVAGGMWSITVDQPQQVPGQCTLTQTYPDDPLNVKLRLTGCRPVQPGQPPEGTVHWTLYGQPQSATITGATGTPGTHPTTSSPSSSTTTPTPSTTHPQPSTSNPDSTTSAPSPPGSPTARPPSGGGAADGRDGPTGPTALVGTSGPVGGPSPDGSGRLALEIIVGGLALATGGAGLRHRRRPSPDRRSPDRPKGTR
jgi:hypothetical protein